MLSSAPLFSNRLGRLMMVSAFLLFLGSQLLAAPIAHAGGTVSVCDEAHLLTALTGGGTVTFSCSGTITLANTITIASHTTIDGTGQNVTLSGNNAKRVFMVNSGIALTLNQITVTAGHLTSGLGAAIYNNNGTVNATDVTFSNNVTEFGSGGAIYNDTNGTLNITGTTFSGNTNNNSGGSVLMNYGAATLTNSTLSGNTVTGGEAALFNYGTITMTNSTLTGNRSIAVSPAYSGIYNSYSGGASVIIRNSIIANGTGAHCDGNIANITGTNNLADDGTCGSSFTNSSSIALGALGNYGGKAQTVPLNANSAAMDAGNPTYCPGTDQRGQARADLQCDSGAYEMQMSDRNYATLAPGTTMRTYGPARAGIQYAGTNPGSTTVTKITTWVSQPASALSVMWDIAAPTNTGLNLTVKLCYSTAELRGLTEGDLRFWRYSGGAWSQVGGVPTFSGTTPTRCAEISGVTDLSRWTLATGNPGNTPTAVTLSTFEAKSSFDLGIWLRKLLGR